MFSEGRLTASVLDSGDSQSYIIPVAQGYTLKNLIKKIPLAGRTITERLTKLLFLRGYALNSTADFETTREIKERLCFIRYFILILNHFSEEITVDKNLDAETTCFEEDYVLPDGTKITIGKERFEAPEILFTPWIGNLESCGLGELVFESIRGAETSLRP